MRASGRLPPRITGFWCCGLTVNAARAVRPSGWPGTWRNALRDVPWRRGRHPAYGKAHGQIREHLLLALLAGGAPLPGLQQPHVAYRMVDLHHTDAAGR